MATSIHTAIPAKRLLKITDRLLDRVRRSPNGCWEWTHSLSQTGYGIFRIHGYGSPLVHRHIYQLFCGPIADGMKILHTCDNPKCCNPTHLKQGSHFDNMQDMVSKGRGVAFGRYKIRKYLTDEERRAIRIEHVAGHPDRGAEALARKYGISSKSIRSLVRK